MKSVEYFSIFLNLWFYPDVVLTQFRKAFSKSQRDKSVIAYFEFPVENARFSEIHQMTGGSDLKFLSALKAHFSLSFQIEDLVLWFEYALMLYGIYSLRESVVDLIGTIWKEMFTV